MKPNYSFNKIITVDEITSLKKEWVASLTSPQDGMWAFFRNSSINWRIDCGEKMIGYASIGEENRE